jgi:tryptophan synthase alpha chain
LAEYKEHYQSVFEAYGLHTIFLITPQTSEARIREIDAASKGFIYMVSSASTTGSEQGFGVTQEAYFNRIDSLSLSNPQIVGFGINNAKTFSAATKKAKGAIIGSAFIKMLSKDGIQGISKFVNAIR